MKMSEALIQTPLTADNLRANGYKRHSREGADPWLNRASGLFQKKMIDANGDAAFFLDIYWYDFSAYSHFPRREGWSPEVQFNTHSSRPTFNVGMLTGDDSTIEEAEAFFWRMYRLME